MGSKDRTLAALLLAACSFASACEPPGVEAEAPLEIVVPTEVRTLDPRYSTGSLDIKINRLVHAGLTTLDPETLEPRPFLARRLEFLDQQTLEVDLRPELVFHSGKPLEADDVCATLEALAHPELRSPHQVVVQAIERCWVTGPSSLRIRVSAPRASLLSDLEVPILRRDQVAERIDAVELDGLGPYRFGRVLHGEVELAPANTGVLPTPRHRLVVRTVRDANARVLRLMVGKADIAPNSVSPALLPALANEPTLTIRTRSGANVTYLLIHNERPPFDDPEIRKALSMALDRELICRSLLADRAEVAGWLLPAEHWASADYPPVPYSRERARERLRGKGPITLLTSTDRVRVTIARAIAQMLGDAGLETQVVALDLGVLLDRLDRGDYTLSVLQMPELTEPNLLLWFFHGERVPGEGLPGKNRARYRNPAADRLLDQAARIVGREPRAELYRQLAQVMLADMPVVPLWHEDQVVVLSSRARSFELSAEGRWLDAATIE